MPVVTNVPAELYQIGVLPKAHDALIGTVAEPFTVQAVPLVTERGESGIGLTVTINPAEAGLAQVIELVVIEQVAV